MNLYKKKKKKLNQIEKELTNQKVAFSKREEKKVGFGFL
jgi:hypothetical protein